MFDSKCALTVLNRLAGRKLDQMSRLEEALRGRLEELAAVALDVAVETGDPIGRVLANQIELSSSFELVNHVLEICDEGAYQSSTPLREVAAEATRKMLDFCQKIWRHPDLEQQAEIARLALNLGFRLRALGRLEEAVGYMQDALARYRPLAEETPEKFQARLAICLDNLGIVLSDLGRLTEGLEVTQESAELSRRLAGGSTSSSEPDLYIILNDLGNRLAALGRLEEACDATQEAVDLWRQRRSMGVESASRLAQALSNLGARLYSLGRHREALRATREAVELNRQLAAERPDACLPDLAGSLLNLGAMHKAAGSITDALLVTEEAAAFYQKLALERPDAFLSSLASCFLNAGVCKHLLGLREEAIQDSRAAVVILRRLLCQHPEAFQSGLSEALNNLGGLLHGLGLRMKPWRLLRRPPINSGGFLCGTRRPSRPQWPRAFTTSVRCFRTCRAWKKRCR